MLFLGDLQHALVTTLHSRFLLPWHMSLLSPSKLTENLKAGFHKVERFWCAVCADSQEGKHIYKVIDGESLETDSIFLCLLLHKSRHDLKP